MPVMEDFRFIILIFQLQYVSSEPESALTVWVDDFNRSGSGEISKEDVSNGDVNSDSVSESDSSTSSSTSGCSISFYDRQVGGHRTLMKDDEGFVLKSNPMQSEIDFYEILAKTQDPALLELKMFTSKYGGLVTDQWNDLENTYIRIEDITHNFKSPSIMDLKIGKQTWLPGAPEKKILRQKAKYVAMRERWGFSIPGFQYYDHVTGELHRFGRSYGRSMKVEDGIDALYNFVNGKYGLKTELIRQIVQQLKTIFSWFEYQTHYKFYGSSILVAYDAFDSVTDVDSSKVRVRMIDFSHAIPNKEKTLDLNYAHGLKMLMEVIQNLDFHREEVEMSIHRELIAELFIKARETSTFPKEDTGSILPYSLVERLNDSNARRLNSIFWKAGIKRDSDGFLLKAAKEKGELYFYEALEKTRDPILLELKKFLPSFGGYKIIHSTLLNKDITYIRLENMTKNLFIPCIMKIGFGEENEGSKMCNLEQSSDQEIGKIMGFYISNLLYYDAADSKKFIKYGRFHSCDSIPSGGGLEAIYNFLNGKLGLKTELVDQISKELRKINFWFNRQKYHRFYSNGIIIVYDALSIMKPNFTSVTEGVRVRIIDFSRTGIAPVSNTGSEMNSNNRIFLRGLKNLIKVFENFDFAYNYVQEQEVEEDTSSKKEYFRNIGQNINYKPDVGNRNFTSTQIFRQALTSKGYTKNTKFNKNEFDESRISHNNFKNLSCI